MRDYITQVISTIAIILGLGLVIYELRQTRLIAEVQVIQEYFNIVQTSRNAFWEDGTLEALAKSCEAEALTTKDAIVLDAYFSELLSHVSRQVTMERTGFTDNPNLAKFAAEVQFARVFAHEAGIRYWLDQRDQFNPLMRGFGDEILKRNQFRSCQEKMTAIATETSAGDDL